MKVSHPHDQELDRQLIHQLRQNLIDEAVLVDDLRAELNALPEKLRDAIARRDCTAGELDEAIRRWNYGTAA
jgi:hypothetical protein